jgi:spore coat protein JA
MSTNRKTIMPYISKHDPCKPLKEKTYETPPQLYLGVQDPDLEQYSLFDALESGTLWPALYSPYSSPFKEPDSDKNAPTKKGR